MQVKGSYKVEVEKFETSKAFSKMIERVNRRVGLQLDNEEARLMWNICRWQKFDCENCSGLRLPGTWERIALGVPCLWLKTWQSLNFVKISNISTSKLWQTFH